MKVATLSRQFRRLPAVLLLAVLALSSQPLQAQDAYPGADILYSRAELAQMLAPIALYPDALLSQVLMASTYPIEVVEADRWVRRHPDLHGDALDDALLDRDWDPSVKALCHFPTVLALMSERIAETTRIGNAFLAQEAEVMDVIQELRAQAYAHGNLASDERQTVIVERPIIIIEPVNPRMVYLPYYNPLYVYGPWPYPGYPPYYWGPPGISIGVHIGYWPDIIFSFLFINWSYFDWHHHYIHVDLHKRPRFVRHDYWVKLPDRWRHAPHHRRGVAYRDVPTARKYGQYPQPPRDYDRDLRGYPAPPQRDTGRVAAPQPAIEPERRVREPTERPRQPQQRITSEEQQRQRTREAEQQAERDRQARERTAQERLQQQQDERNRLHQQRAEQERQRSQQSAQEQQRRQRAEQQRLIQQRAEQERQRSQRIAPAQPAPQRVQPTTPRQAMPRPEPSRDNIFNRVDNGQQERRSSERGRSSRQSPVAGGRAPARVIPDDQEQRDKRVPGRR